MIHDKTLYVITNITFKLIDAKNNAVEQVLGK